MSDGDLRVSLSAYPGMSRFVLHWLGGESSATQLLPRRGAGGFSTPQREGGLKPAAPPELVDALIESNRQWGISVEDQVRGWAAGERVALIAGQQAGFAGGPLYTLAKIASLLKMKRDLERAGQSVTTFFWLATEDHDFDEVARISIPVSALAARSANRQADLLNIRARRPPENRSVVGPLPIPEALIAQLLAAYPIERPSWLRPGITFRDSFAELIAAAAGEKIVLVDALLPALRRAAAPLFTSVFEKWDRVDEALARASRRIEDCGYLPQVLPRDNGRYTLLYRIEENGERRLIEEPEPLGDPATISTSALTRPLVQDFVFRPAVFVGGPAEVSYYAQIRELHDLLGVALPAVALRGHLLVAPRRTVRLFDRHHILPEEAFSTAEAIAVRTKHEQANEIREIAMRAGEDLAQALTRIGEIALPAQHSLARAISRSIGHIEYHFDKLTERATRALARQDRERYDAAREIVATFYPDRQVQDRIVAWLPFWSRHGNHLIERMVEEIEPDSAALGIIAL